MNKAGNKTGGRAKGVKNKTSLGVEEMLKANGFDAGLPFLYWARVLRAHLAPRPKRGPDRAESFYQGKLLVSDGGENGQHVEDVWARPTDKMANDAAKGLAPYLRPQLMRIQGTGTGGALVVEFGEDHRTLGKTRPEDPAGAPHVVRVELGKSFKSAAGAKARVREL